MKSKDASTCTITKKCSRCGYPIEGIKLVCPRCREPISGGCSGNCSKCSSHK